MFKHGTRQVFRPFFSYCCFRSRNSSLEVAVGIRNYSTAATHFQTIKSLVESTKLGEALDLFRKNPTPHDGAYLMNKGYSMDQCLEMYSKLRERRDLSIPLIVSLLSTMNKTGSSNQQQQIILFKQQNDVCRDLAELLKITSTKRKMNINSITWNFILKQLSLFPEDFAKDIVTTMEYMLKKCKCLPLEGSVVTVLSALANTYNVTQSREIINLLVNSGAPLSVKYYTIYLRLLILTNRTEEATKTLLELTHEIELDSLFFTSLIAASTEVGADGRAVGELCHELCVKHNVAVDLQLENTLISFYCKFSDTNTAFNIFKSMKAKNVITWNIMISGFTKNKEFEQSLALFENFLSQNLKPNESLLLSIMNTYASMGNTQKTQELLESMKPTYGITPTANHYGCLIKSLLMENKLELALEVFNQNLPILLDNPGILILLLSSSMKHNDKSKGMDIYYKVVNNNKLLNENDLITVSIRMLCKYGEIEKAISLFHTHKTLQKSKVNINTWTSIIHGMGLNGRGVDSINLFYEMLGTTDIKPDAILFTSLLTACSHAGMVEQASQLFELSKKYFVPSEVHYCCMVDTYGRAGMFKEAEHYLSFVPSDMVALMSILGACRKHNNIELAEKIFEKILELDATFAPALVLMSNIYSSHKLVPERNRMWKLMESNGIKKIPGTSYLSVNNKVHAFVCDEKHHPNKKEIYEELDKLSTEMEEAGFKQDTSWVTKDIPEEEKSDLLCRHSEKIAIAFGLISTPEGSPLTIVKNLRVCGDCHEATKFISKLRRREIILTDSNRVHHFKDGHCSCGDYF